MTTLAILLLYFGHDNLHDTGEMEMAAWHGVILFASWRSIIIAAILLDNFRVTAVRLSITKHSIFDSILVFKKKCFITIAAKLSARLIRVLFDPRKQYTYNFVHRILGSNNSNDDDFNLSSDLRNLRILWFEKMIEITAKLVRGPTYFSGEMIECYITFANPTNPSHQISQSHRFVHHYLTLPSLNLFPIIRIIIGGSQNENEQSFAPILAGWVTDFFFP